MMPFICYYSFFRTIAIRLRQTLMVFDIRVINLPVFPVSGPLLAVAEAVEAGFVVVAALVDAVFFVGFI